MQVDCHANDSNVRIRPVRCTDIADLIRLGEVANLSPWSAQNYLDELKNPDAIMLRLISADNAVVGFIVGRTVSGGCIDVVADAEIYNIMVDAEHRKLGLAQLLLDSFLNECRRRQVVNVWLEVRESNYPAIAFYTKNRFQQVHTRKNFYSNPTENALLMRRFLKASNA